MSGSMRSELITFTPPGYYGSEPHPQGWFTRNKKDEPDGQGNYLRQGNGRSDKTDVVCWCGPEAFDLLQAMNRQQNVGTYIDRRFIHQFEDIRDLSVLTGNRPYTLCQFVDSPAAQLLLNHLHMLSTVNNGWIISLTPAAYWFPGHLHLKEKIYQKVEGLGDDFPLFQVEAMNETAAPTAALTACKDYLLDRFNHRIHFYWSSSLLGRNIALLHQDEVLPLKLQKDPTEANPQSEGQVVVFDGQRLQVKKAIMKFERWSRRNCGTTSELPIGPGSSVPCDWVKGIAAIRIVE